MRKKPETSHVLQRCKTHWARRSLSVGVLSLQRSVLQAVDRVNGAHHCSVRASESARPCGGTTGAHYSVDCKSSKTRILSSALLTASLCCWSL